MGFAFAFGSADVLGISDALIGSNGFFLQYAGNPAEAFPVMGLSAASPEAKFLFQFSFCAVSLAIVWGSTLERIKYSAYVIYAIIFASIIYPIGSHWVFGGGWLQNGDTPLMPTGMQDFAGLHGGPPHRCDRRAVLRCFCSARVRASTAPTASPGPSRVTPCRSSASAC